ncbi:MAG: hypothetical protein RIT43_756 [Bacteroidota bacterium]|jgi:hypothetical protein
MKEQYFKIKFIFESTLLRLNEEFFKNLAAFCWALCVFRL